MYIVPNMKYEVTPLDVLMTAHKTQSLSPFTAYSYVALGMEGCVIMCSFDPMHSLRFRVFLQSLYQRGTEHQDGD